jgi:hypothetical protein
MKNLILCISLVTLLFLGVSCSDSDKNVVRLLKYVPQDAEFVAAVNLESASDKLKEPLQQAFEGASDSAELFKCIKNTAAVAFKKGNVICVMWFVDDPDEFQSLIEKQIGKLTKKDGMLVGNGIIMKDNQVWVSPNQTADLQRFTDELKENYGSTEGGKRLIEMKDDLSMIASVDLLNSSNIPNTQYLSMLWNDASYIYIGADLDKEKIETKCEVLNRKYKQASFLLPLQDVDMNVVKKLNSNLDIVAAIGYDSSVSVMLMPILGGNYSDLLSAINGTIAFGLDTGSESGMFAIQLADAGKSSAVENIIKTLLPGNKNLSAHADGNCLVATYGSLDGGFPFENLLNKAKGAKAIAMCNMNGMNEKAGNLSYQPINNILLTLRPSDKSAVIELICYFNEGGLANLSSLRNIFAPSAQQDIPDYDFDEDDQPLMP